MAIRTVYLDIETLPGPDPAAGAESAAQQARAEAFAGFDEWVANLTPPATHKKPETIDAWHAEKKPDLIEKERATRQAAADAAAAKAEQAFRKTALAAMLGRVYCVAWAVDDGPVNICAGSEEGDAVRGFWRAMVEIERTLDTIRYCGHNVRAFDLPFLIAAGLRLDCELPRQLGQESRPYGVQTYPVFDTMIVSRELVLVSGESASLDYLCRAWGIPAKGDIDGAGVYDAWLAGRHSDIMDYCRADVERVRALAARLEPLCASRAQTRGQTMSTETRTPPAELAALVKQVETPAVATARDADPPWRECRTAADVVSRVDFARDVCARAMSPDVHFGSIGGGGGRQVLLKPGAETLALAFSLAPSYEVTRNELPGGHREYTVRCRMMTPDGRQVSECSATCSTMESKYRWRWQSTGIRPEAGFVPSQSRKLRLAGGRQVIHERVENEDIADVWNTALKMAEKRAYVGAVITATACSDRFTQDIEPDASPPDDDVIDAPAEVATAEAPQEASPNPMPAQEAAPAEQTVPNPAGEPPEMPAAALICPVGKAAKGKLWADLDDATLAAAWNYCRREKPAEMSNAHYNALRIVTEEREAAGAAPLGIRQAMEAWGIDLDDNIPF